MEDESPRSSLPILALAGIAIAIGLGALIFVLTCGTVSAPAARAPAIATPARPAPSTAYTITSTNPDVKVALLSELPRSPGSTDADCNADATSPPRSPGAKAAAAKGWLIADEGRLGPLTAVAIASGFVTGTSAVCFAEHGNVALFDGDRLVAILYTRRAPTNEEISGFEPRGSGLRIALSGPVTPLGDLTLNDHAIRLGPFAASETVCGGRHQLPNIYDLDIAVARRKLMAAGWKPMPVEDDPANGELSYFAAELRKKGIVEVQDCLPTGYGQCFFQYGGAGGDGVDVTSTGDTVATVTSYSATCGS